MNLSWYSLTWQELPEALMKEFKFPSYRMNDPYSANSDVVLGISEADYRRDPFIAVVLVGTAKNEVFSWISTYVEEAFPLTQFCRVCSVEDWKQLQLQNRKESMIGKVSPILTSIVLGEMLGQADADTNVAGIPLARATACFSFAIARTVLLYPSLEIAQNMCAERLVMVERDSRFGRRPISVETLKKVWSVAQPLLDVLNESLNVIETVLQIVAAIDKQAAQLLTTNNLLLSDSAEDRVGGFDIVADALFERLNSNAIGRDAGTVALAAAAVLAGRGTSHIHLLASAAKSFPETLVWYGLLAGVLGPRGWDKAWRQQTKGVERALRQFFRPDEPVSADICWPEYDWLSMTFDSLKALSSLPKNTTRSLTIELLPGVNCQFRLGSQVPNTRANEEQRIVDMEGREVIRAISESTLAQALELLSQAQQILRLQVLSRSPIQKSLFEQVASTIPNQLTRRKSGDKPVKKPNK